MSPMGLKAITGEKQRSTRLVPGRTSGQKQPTRLWTAHRTHRPAPLNLLPQRSHRAR